MQKSLFALILLLALVLQACSPAQSIADSLPTQVPPTQTAQLSATPEPPPSPTPEPSPTPTATQTTTPLVEVLASAATATLTPTLAASPTVTPTVPSGRWAGLPAPAPDPVWIYFIQRNNGGPICGGSLVAVNSGVSRTGNIAKDIKAGLQVLLSIKSELLGTLYNPLARSSIRVQAVKYDGGDGLITVQLVGKYARSDEDCENTYVKSQVWTTIRQFREITATNIYLNRVPFGDLVSNDG